MKYILIIFCNILGLKLCGKLKSEVKSGGKTGHYGQKDKMYKWTFSTREREKLN